MTYNGSGPVHWSSGPGDFGLQDKAARLHPGASGEGGGVSFAFSLQVKAGGATLNFLGDFAHGPRDGRFLYLGWRNRTGELAQRPKLPLGSISWDDVRRTLATGEPLSCVLVDLVEPYTRSGISTYWTSGSDGSSTRVGEPGSAKRNSAVAPICSATSSR